MDSATGRRRTVEWLMAEGSAPDVEALLDEMTRRPEWHQWAAYRGAGIDAFFPERSQSSDGARAVCESCEVRAECLEAALANGDKHGIWGAVSERWRRVLRQAVA